MITLLLLVRATYMNGVVVHAHPVRGESHNQRNTTGKVATMHFSLICCDNYLQMLMPNEHVAVLKHSCTFCTI